jgi:choline-sulfatase
MVSLIDRNVGRILGELKRQGLDQDTVVVFTSDHGDFLGDHGLLYKMHMAFDSLLRVPCIIRAPGCGLPHRYEGAMSNVDVLPLLASLCGVPLASAVHGSARLRDGAGEVPVLSFASTGYARWVGCTVYDDTHRYTTYPVGGIDQCFDHRADPGECRNLAAEGKVPSRLRGLLAEGLLRCWQPNAGQLSVW